MRTDRWENPIAAWQLANIACSVQVLLQRAEDTANNPAMAHGNSLEIAWK